MYRKIFNILILLSIFLVKVSFTQEISTLFTTPEERAYLNFLRDEFLLNSQLTDFNIDEVVPVVPVIVDDEEGVPSISTYTLGGIFTREDGTRTVWLNELSINENYLPENMQLVMSNTSTLLRIQTDSGLFDLRAGQTLDVVNSQVLESWQFTLPEQNNEITENISANIVEEPSENELVDLEDDIATEENNELVDPLPGSNPEVLSISAGEISSIISSEDPVALAELMQILQSFEEVQINASEQ